MSNNIWIMSCSCGKIHMMNGWKIIEDLEEYDNVCYNSKHLMKGVLRIEKHT